MAGTFNLFLNTGQIDQATSGAYDLLFNQYGYTGDLSLDGVGNFKSGINVTTHLGVGANTYASGDVNTFANNFFNAKSYVNNIDITGNTFISQITGGMRSSGDFYNTGKISNVGDLQITGDSYLTGNLDIRGTLTINGEEYSATFLSESANSSTGDFSISGNLLPEGYLFMSGNPSAAIGTPLVSLTGYTSSRNVLEITRGSIMVTGNGSNTGYFRGAYKATDGSVGLSRVISIFDSNISQDHVLTFKGGILTNYTLS